MSGRAVVIYPQRSLDPNDRLPYKLLLLGSQVQRIYLDELDTGENSVQVAMVKLIIEREETAPVVGIGVECGTSGGGSRFDSGASTASSPESV
ncbi:MAG: DUF2887 domain-containing protein [Nostoc sp.]|uniref:DUF2887 domain-containing protein n=1 Tax=Nostoc sp. TaxID=1180 RepID=UPI002FFBCCA4